MYYVCIMSPLSLSLCLSLILALPLLPSSFVFFLFLSFLSLLPHSSYVLLTHLISLLSFPLSIFPSLSSGLVVSSDDRLGDVVEESQDLKGVWVELGKIWEQID